MEGGQTLARNRDFHGVVTADLFGGLRQRRVLEYDYASTPTQFVGKL